MQGGSDLNLKACYVSVGVSNLTIYIGNIHSGVKIYLFHAKNVIIGLRQRGFHSEFCGI